MSRRNHRPALTGIVCLDKPIGPTSFDLVRHVRRVTHQRRVGHGGTLDPFASGLLVLALGSATRLLNYVSDAHKVYETIVYFGVATDSDDPTGQEIAHGNPEFDRHDFLSVRDEFVGDIVQQPPLLSALHVDGERSYARARRGDHSNPPQPRTVRIDSIEVLDFDLPRVRLRVRCGSGTYVRSLARELGERLGCPAHLEALRREEVGSLTLADAVTPEAFADAWRSDRPGWHTPLAAVRSWSRMSLTAEQVTAIRYGNQPEREWWTEVPPKMALVDPNGDLVALAQSVEGQPRLAMVLARGGTHGST